MPRAPVTAVAPEEEISYPGSDSARSSPPLRAFGFHQLRDVYGGGIRLKESGPRIEYAEAADSSLKFPPELNEPCYRRTKAKPFPVVPLIDTPSFDDFNLRLRLSLYAIA